MCSFQEKKKFILCPYEEMFLHGNFLMHCHMVLLPNNNFLISKEKKTSKIDPKF